VVGEQKKSSLGKPVRHLIRGTPAAVEKEGRGGGLFMGSLTPGGKEGGAVSASVGGKGEGSADRKRPTTTTGKESYWSRRKGREKGSVCDEEKTAF